MHIFAIKDFFEDLETDPYVGFDDFNNENEISISSRGFIEAQGNN